MTDAAERRLRDALAPVRATLLGTARADADRLAAEADARAGALLATAEEQAARIIAAARAAGARDAAARSTAERTRARRAARSRALQTRRLAYERLREQSRAAVGRLGDEPGLRAALAAAARHRLGPDAAVVDVDGGGIIATLADRRIDLSLAGFADRAVDFVADELDRP